VPDFRQTGWIGTKRAFALILIASLLLLGLSGLAQATTTPAIQDAQGQARALKNLIDKLDEKLSAAAENYNYAHQQLDDTQAAIKTTQEQLTQSQGDLATAQQQLNKRVVEIYKSGDLSMLGVLLNASSFTDLIGRYEQLRRLGAQDAHLLTQIADYKSKMSQQSSQLDAALKQEQTDVQKTEAAKQEVEAQLAIQKQALKGKEVQIAQLKKEEAARQAALVAAAKKAAAEAARKAAAAKAAAAAAAKKNHTPTTDSSGGNGSNSGGSGGAELVDYAMKFVGVPYVWAGSTPSGFDCSGFTSYVYKHFGIYLPHSSVMQYDYGTPVAQGDLKPGDLVFFFSPIHHVGIAMGNGLMINERTGGVQIESVYWNSYTGARRILK
jgi:cell wall-associated NlpC family hydrolase